MRYRTTYLFGCFLALWCLAATGVRAQSTCRPDGALPGVLAARGFEDVAVYAAEDTLVLGFEYRLTRSPAPGVREALAEARASGCAAVVAVLYHDGVATTALTFDTDGRTRGASYGVRRYARRLAEARPARRERLLDVAVHPYYRALYGFYGDPFQVQLAAAPQLNVRLWQGMELSGQVLLPLVNKLAEEGDHVRPGVVTLAQLVRLPGPVFVSAAAGTFTDRRFGADVRVRAPLAGGRLTLGADVGRTGEIFYPNGSIFIRHDPRLTALASAALFLPRYALTLRAQGGRFLYDAGVRVDLLRQFRGIDVGFFAAATGRGDNAGLSITVPLSGGRFLQAGPARLRPAAAYTFDYAFKSEVLVAEHYATGRGLDDALRRYRPAHLRHLLADDEAIP